MEYALVLLLVGVLCVAAVLVIGPGIDSMLDPVGTAFHPAGDGASGGEGRPISLPGEG